MEPSNSNYTPQAIVHELTAIWKRALDLAELRADQTFLSLGGDSLDAMHILMAVEQRFGVELANSLLFDHPTIASLAAVVDERLRARQASAVRRAA